MPFFSISANVTFVQKPQWLELFKQKHNRVEYDYHVTLTQPRLIAESDIPHLKRTIETYFANTQQRTLPIDFNRIVADGSECNENDGCIMMCADNTELAKLQLELVQCVANYPDYVNPKTAAYENNFRPHITIADLLDCQAFESAKNEIAQFTSDTTAHCVLTRVVLTIVHSSEKREEFVFELVK